MCGHSKCPGVILKEDAVKVIPHDLGTQYFAKGLSYYLPSSARLKISSTPHQGNTCFLMKIPQMLIVKPSEWQNHRSSRVTPHLIFLSPPAIKMLRGINFGRPQSTHLFLCLLWRFTPIHSGQSKSCKIWGLITTLITLYKFNRNQHLCIAQSAANEVCAKQMLLWNGKSNK